MSKLILNTIDDQKEFTFKKAAIFSFTYSMEIEANQIHSPYAAKVIIKDNTSIFCFIVLSPIIKSDKNGNIEIFTDSTLKQATLVEKYKKSKRDIKEIKTELKLLNSRYELGITVQNLVEMGINRPLYEAMILEDRVENRNKWGGF